MTPRPINLDEFGALFDTVRHSSWRWECQGYYSVDAPDVDAWLAGERVPETDDDRAWVAYIRDLHARDIPFERVRMLTEPLTDYLRWMVATTDRNVRAGEEIRWVDESTARDLVMPGYDFYLFDDDRVVIMRFDADKTLVEVTLDDDPAVVAAHQEHRSRAWRAAVRHAEYAVER